MFLGYENDFYKDIVWEFLFRLNFIFLKFIFFFSFCCECIYIVIVGYIY